MSKGTSSARALARAHMFLEASDHMRGDIIDILDPTGPIEREEATRLANRLEAEASRWFEFADRKARLEEEQSDG